MMNLPVVDIIIVHWNSPEFLSECVNSLENSSSKQFRFGKIWIVDNASTEKRFDIIRLSDLPVEIIENSENIGFAKANNQVGLISNADYLFLMNPDVQVEEKTLDRLTCFSEDPGNKKIGIVGACMRLGNGEMLKECTDFPDLRRLLNDFLGLDRISQKLFPTFRLHTWSHETTREVDHVMGGACFVRTELFRNLGGLDERYFLYYVDLDFSKRMALSGYKSVFLSDAEVIHKTDEIKDSSSAFRYFYSIKGRFVYVNTHMSSFSLVIVGFASIFVEPVLRLGRAMLKLNTSEVLTVLNTYRLLLKDLVR